MSLEFDYVQREIVKELSYKQGMPVEAIESILLLHSLAVKRLMMYGSIDKKPYISRIKLGKIGEFRIKHRALRNKMFNPEGIKEEDLTKEFKYAKAYLEKNNWKYFDWTVEDGFMFINTETSELYKLQDNKIYNAFNAEVRFAEIVNKDKAKHGLDFTRVSMLKEFTIRRVAEYTMDGDLIEVHNNIYNAHKKSGININKLGLALEAYGEFINKSNKVGSLNKRLWYYLDGEAPQKIYPNVGKATVKHNFLIDMCDAEGNVLIKEIGKPYEAVQLLKAITNKSNIKVSPILRVLDTGKKMYGYVWNKSIRIDNTEEN